MTTGRTTQPTTTEDRAAWRKHHGLISANEFRRLLDDADERDALAEENKRLRATLACDDATVLCCDRCDRTHHRTCPKIAEAERDRLARENAALREERDARERDALPFFAVLVQRLGGRVLITPTDIEAVRPLVLQRGDNFDPPSVYFALTPKPQEGV